MTTLQSNTNSTAGNAPSSAFPSGFDISYLKQNAKYHKDQPRKKKCTDKQLATNAERRADGRLAISNAKISASMKGIERKRGWKLRLRARKIGNTNAKNSKRTQEQKDARSEATKKRWAQFKAGTYPKKEKIMTYTEEQISKFRKFDEDAMLKRFAANKKRNAANRKREKIKAAKLKEINTKPKTAAKTAVTLPKREVLPDINTLIGKETVAVKTKEEIQREEYNKKLKAHYGY